MAELKRKSGTGCIRLRKDGRWEGRVVTGYDDKGLPQTKNILAHTKAECEEKLAALREEIGTSPKPKLGLTFGEWIDFWYRTYSKPGLRATTAAGYENSIYKHIIPAIGHLLLNNITADDLQKFYADLKSGGRLIRGEIYWKGLSDRSVRACGICCKSALEQAVEDGLLRRNPADGCKLPPKKAREMQTLTQDEMRRLLLQAKADGFFELFLVDLFTGLRRGELLGLKWDDMDFETGELHIRRQVHPTNGESVPKTKAGIRTIVLPSSLLEILKAYQPTTNSRWVFPSPCNPDVPRNPSACRKMFSKILERAGCKHIPFHAIRHTFAELCLEGGMDIKTLSATLGHESVSTALNVYTHVNDSMREQAAAKIDRRVARTSDCDGGQPETGTDTTDPAKSEEPPAFAPYKSKIRRRGTGCVSRISDSLWEGRYSPRNLDGTRACHTVYAHSEEECEAMLAEMIERVKGERKGTSTS